MEPLLPEPEPEVAGAGRGAALAAAGGADRDVTFAVPALVPVAPLLPRLAGMAVVRASVTLTSRSMIGISRELPVSFVFLSSILRIAIF